MCQHKVLSIFFSFCRRSPFCLVAFVFLPHLSGQIDPFFPMGWTRNRFFEERTAETRHYRLLPSSLSAPHFPSKRPKSLSRKNGFTLVRSKPASGGFLFSLEYPPSEEVAFRQAFVGIVRRLRSRRFPFALARSLAPFSAALWATNRLSSSVFSNAFLRLAFPFHGLETKSIFFLSDDSLDVR